MKQKCGDENGALADFNRAIKLSVRWPEPYAGMAFVQYNMAQWQPALENFEKSLELNDLNDDSRFYIWLIRAQTNAREQGDNELREFLKFTNGEKVREWSSRIARFLVGDLSENEFLAQASTTAPRPTAVTAQVCEAYYYASMKRKLAGDTQGAMDFLRKCLDTRDDNNWTYWSACAELRYFKRHQITSISFL